MKILTDCHLSWMRITVLWNSFQVQHKLQVAMDPSNWDQARHTVSCVCISTTAGPAGEWTSQSKSYLMQQLLKWNICSGHCGTSLWSAWPAAAAAVTPACGSSVPWSGLWKWWSIPPLPWRPSQTPTTTNLSPGKDTHCWMSTAQLKADKRKLSFLFFSRADRTL